MANAAVEIEQAEKEECDKLVAIPDSAQRCGE
jgi:hypothetical protein